MAARIRKHHQPWRFYVYAVRGADQTILYVGKGSGKRMHVSCKERGGASVEQIACFKAEEDAYTFEVQSIADLSPKYNVHKGGNGSRANPVRDELPRWAKQMAALGSRKYAARLWLNALEACRRSGMAFVGDASKLDQVRGVAYG